MTGIRYGAAGISDGATYGRLHEGYGDDDYGAVYGGDTTTTIEGGTYGLHEHPERGKDITIAVGRTRADSLRPPVPTVTIGETMTLPVDIDPRGLQYYEQRYNQLRDRIEYADETVTVGQTIDGTPWFSETHDREKLLVKVIPGKDLYQVRGVWGVIVGGTDETDFPHTAASMEIELYVLARLNDYDTAGALRDDLER